MTDPIPPAEAPVPPVPVPATESTTAHDVASDLAGEPRSEEPPLTPPGTSPTRFWESSGAKVALGTTLAFGLMFVKAAILQVPVNRELVAASAEGLAWVWAVAFGIQRTDTASLRWR